jgi:predicted DsbA family dithiol-disulfide isomerase
MHDLLFAHQLELEETDLIEYAALAGLDLTRFRDDLQSRRYEPRVRDCLSSAPRSGADRTPSFFLNGRRHFPLGLKSLEEAGAGAIAGS